VNYSILTVGGSAYGRWSQVVSQVVSGTKMCFLNRKKRHFVSYPRWDKDGTRLGRARDHILLIFILNRDNYE